MAESDFKTVDEYIVAQPETARVVLKRVRTTIRKALPGAEEVISYKIPAYKLRGVVVLYFAGWKQHYSLYPAGERLVTAFKDQLASYSVSKGTIRFPFSEPVPAKLIERISKVPRRTDRPAREVETSLEKALGRALTAARFARTG